MTEASDQVFEALKKCDDLVYLDTMNEVLLLAIAALESARESQDDIRLGTFIWMAGRCLQTAVEIHEDRRLLKENK